MTTCPVEKNITSSDAELAIADATVRKFSVQLRAAFGVTFALHDGHTWIALGEDQKWLDSVCFPDSRVTELACAELTQTQPEIIGEFGPVIVLALPLIAESGLQLLAVAGFVVQRPTENENLSRMAELMGRSVHEVRRWFDSQPIWAAENLLRMAGLVLEKISGDKRVNELTAELESVTGNLASTYEEISLLHRLTQNLRISMEDEELGQLALDWLADVLPADGVALLYLPVVGDEETADKARTESVWLTAGHCPLDGARFSQLAGKLGNQKSSTPLVINGSVTGAEDWRFHEIRQLILVPLSEGDNLFGWVAAVNHTSDSEFGTVEASLLSSVAMILAIHSANTELYRQQVEFLASVVRALTSAIDAKDPYTCGHSDRVGRVCVRLGREMGLDSETLNRIYLSGLLHDIGKIGIDDNVLRKPGRLSDTEYQHIKMHPELGHKILRELKQLDDVLPVVLYHHEQWNGEGYPHGLKEQQIPLLARICAVADAYDAMSSDRPYRVGLEDKILNQIMQNGSGVQWDPEVIDAFFRARDDIRKISRRERGAMNVGTLQWT